MTLAESAAGAVLPWNSIDAESAFFETLPQQNIEVCLMCQHCASYCETCGEWGKKKSGRPRKEIDYEKLDELLRLRKCNAEICAALGISAGTLRQAKKGLKLIGGFEQ